MAWLQETPMAVVVAHFEMMDRLQAEEQMAAAACAGVGQGSKAGDWIRRQWAQWRHTARGNTRAVKATPADLAAMGMGQANG